MPLHVEVICTEVICAEVIYAEPDQLTQSWPENHGWLRNPDRLADHDRQPHLDWQSRFDPHERTERVIAEILPFVLAKYHIEA